MKKLGWMAAVLGSAFLIGCASQPAPPLAPVSGTVKLNGQPVAGASVKFIPLNGLEAAASATTEADGTFSLRYQEGSAGAPPGAYKVTLSTERSDIEGAEIFPASYHNPEQTQLIVTVPEGGTTIDLDAQAN